MAGRPSTTNEFQWKWKKLVARECQATSEEAGVGVWMEVKSSTEQDQSGWSILQFIIITEHQGDALVVEQLQGRCNCSPGYCGARTDKHGWTSLVCIWLNSWWLMILQWILCEWENFVFNPLPHFKPKKWQQCRCDMRELGSSTERMCWTVLPSNKPLKQDWHHRQI